MKDVIKNLEILSTLNGTPGNEKQISQEIHKLSLPFVDELFYDNLGSLITKKGIDGPKVLIGAHLDEIGLMVTKITKEGFIKFQTVGAWFSQVMLGQEWQITTSKGIVYAVTGSKPPHLIPLDQRSKAIEIESMFLDVGVSNYEDAVKLGIKPGDMITPSARFRILGDGKHIVGKAFDNRIGSVIILEILKQLSQTPNIVYGAHTIQEEVGSRGAKTTAYMVQPDLAIAIDSGIANDVPGGEAQEQSLGKGPQILLYDTGLIGHPALRQFVIKVANELNIPYQEALLARGSTDGSQFSLAHSGAPTIAITIPTRYLHSHTSMIHLDDVTNTIKLVKAVIEKLDQRTVETITFG